MEIKPSDKISVIKRLISFMLIFSAFIWLSYIVYNDREPIINIFKQFTVKDTGWLILSLCFGGISVFITIFIFKKILCHNIGNELDLKSLAHVYFEGQIVRYLPGRFFGLAYQMNKIKNVHSSVILKANIEYMLLNLLFNTIVAGIIILFYKANTIIFIISVLSGLSLFILYLRYLRFNFIAIFSKQVFPKILRYNFKAEDIIYILMIYIINWSFYLAGWLCIKNALPEFENVNILLICATYTIATVIGILSIITPGGLGIRESVFVLLTSTEISASMMAFMSVFLRFWLIFIDLILFIIVKIVLLAYPKDGDYRGRIQNLGAYEIKQ